MEDRVHYAYWPCYSAMNDSIQRAERRYDSNEQTVASMESYCTVAHDGTRV